MSKQKVTRLTVALGLFAGGLLAAWLIWQYPLQDVTQEVVPFTQCNNVSQGCITESTDLSITFRLPKKVVYLDKFPVEVNVKMQGNVKAQEVYLEFVMSGMNMGVNHYQLIQAKDNNQLWKTQAVLPVCVSGRRDWVANITLKTTSGHYKTAFGFEVTSPGQ